ncbi:hypothetical protein D9M71_733990 [compost metagenome]
MGRECPTVVRVCTKSQPSEGQTKRKAARRRSLLAVNEHSEPLFNAVWPSAGTFRTEPRLAKFWLIHLKWMLSELLHELAHFQNRIVHSEAWFGTLPFVFWFCF